MTNKRILKLVYRLAEELIGRKLNTFEKQRIRNNFYSSSKKSNRKKAIEAIEKSLDIDAKKRVRLIEEGASAGLDDVERLLTQLASAADEKD